MRITKKIFSTLVIFILAVLFFSQAAIGTSLIKMNLSTLVEKSGRIIVGTCLGVEEKTMTVPGKGEILYTSYLFRVSKTIKGSVGGTLELRQVSFPSYVSGNRKPIEIPGMPSYQVDEEYVLILTEESSLGLSVPVGLPQGCFRVSANLKIGTKQISNGLNNAGLFDGMSLQKNAALTQLKKSDTKVLSRKSGAIEYGSFIRILEKLVE